MRNLDARILGSAFLEGRIAVDTSWALSLGYRYDRLSTTTDVGEIGSDAHTLLLQIESDINRF